ncbi:MAG: chemotaxis protein CheB [Gammaproteobacteria bacterium]|nr:chemotaxis protein CheB [Gammaproteobacteria bacterium]
MALVLIQHLHPDHPSLLAEILAKRVALPVLQAQDGVAVEPDHLYVIPPNTSISLSDGRLYLAARAADRTAHKPIDVFFKSLAEECGRNAIGVVLSGTGSDGTRGLQDIRRLGASPLQRSPSRPPLPTCRETPSTRAAWISYCRRRRLAGRSSGSANAWIPKQNLRN